MSYNFIWKVHFNLSSFLLLSNLSFSFLKFSFNTKLYFTYFSDFFFEKRERLANSGVDGEIHLL